MVPGSEDPGLRNVQTARAVAAIPPRSTIQTSRGGRAGISDPGIPRFKEARMAYQLTCADTGAKCPFTVRTEGREELMEHIKVHTRAAHPDMPPPPPDVVEKLIKTV